MQVRSESPWINEYTQNEQKRIVILSIPATRLNGKRESLTIAYCDSGTVPAAAFGIVSGSHHLRSDFGSEVSLTWNEALVIPSFSSSPTP